VRVVIIAIVFCVVAYFAITSIYGHLAGIRRTRELLEQTEMLVSYIVEKEFLEEEFSEVVYAKLNQLIRIYQGRAMIVKAEQDDFTIIKDTAGLYHCDCFDVTMLQQALQNNPISRQERGFIYIYVPIFRVADQPATDVLFVIASMEFLAERMETFRIVAGLIIVTVFFSVFMISFVLSAVVVRPIHKFTSAIEKFSLEHFFVQPLHVDTYQETQLLSKEFNKLVGRLKQIDDSRQEFVASVSHELRTPLTSMKVLSQSLLAMEDAPIELYREFMEDIIKEIDRENDIINDLIFLVKTDSRMIALNIECIDISQLLELILKRLRPIAKLRGIQLHIKDMESIAAEVDEVKMTLLISNLIENAIKYNHENGWVEIFLYQDEKSFYVRVVDSGIGISKANQERLFERFYRVDKSRSSEIEGSGLGLSIAQNVINMHHGTIDVESEVGVGTTFTLCVPLKYEEEIC